MMTSLKILSLSLIYTVYEKIIFFTLKFKEIEIYLKSRHMLAKIIKLVTLKKLAHK